MLLEYLESTYGVNQPIFISRVRYGSCTTNSIRQQIKKLVDAGRLKKYDTGIYFIPGETIFKSGAALSWNKVVEEKYLFDGGRRAGYSTGIGFMNELGLTSQVPSICEITTNKTAREYRRVTVVGVPIVLRKPRVKIGDKNWTALRLLDSMKEIASFSEISGAERTRRLLDHMNAAGVRFQDLAKLLPLYPDQIYRNLYETGLLNGIPA